MNRDLDDLLFELDERRARGEDVSASDLCPDWPEGKAELERGFANLQRCNRLFDLDSSPAPAFVPEKPRRIGRYEILSELGHGGMGIVYHGWDPELEREAAIKVLRRDGFQALPEVRERLVWRFRREAKVLAQLKHESIVPIYGYDIHDGEPFFAMECVAGGSLTKRLGEFTAAGPRVIVPFMAKVAAAVHFAHKNEVLHRDLKPGNILLTGAPTIAETAPKVSDFGLAKLLDEATGAVRVMADETPLEGASTQSFVSSPFTHAGQQPGTPQYMAPEQFDATFGPVGPATDVWALGVVLYEMLTGQRPFPGTLREELREPVCTGKVIKPRRLNRKIDTQLEAIVLRCLAKEPENRYSSADKLARDLSAWRLWRRLRRFAIASAMLLVVGGGFAAGSAWSDPDVKYRIQSENAVWQFDRSDRIDLVAKEKTVIPLHTIRHGAGGTNVYLNDDGLCIDTKSGLGLVEFLRRVPTGHYRITVQIRLDGRHAAFPQCGVYFNHASFVTKVGRWHYAHAAHFCDDAVNPPKGNHSADFVPFFQATLCNDTLEFAPNHLPWIFNDFLGGDRTIEYDRQGRGPPVRTIIVDIHGTKQSAEFLDDTGATVARAKIPPNGAEDAVRQFKMQHPEINKFPDTTISGGSGVGVFVSRGKCTVRKFCVEKLPE